MSDYISRMTEEKNELTLKKAKLSYFMETKDFQNLCEYQKELLKIQYSAMDTYNACLSARIRWAKAL